MLCYVELYSPILAGKFHIRNFLPDCSFRNIGACEAPGLFARAGGGFVERVHGSPMESDMNGFRVLAQPGPPCLDQNADVAQWESVWLKNQRVGGSSPLVCRRRNCRFFSSPCFAMTTLVLRVLRGNPFPLAHLFLVKFRS